MKKIILIISLLACAVGAEYTQLTFHKDLRDGYRVFYTTNAHRVYGPFNLKLNIIKPTTRMDGYYSDELFSVPTFVQVVTTTNRIINFVFHNNTNKYTGETFTAPVTSVIPFREYQDRIQNNEVDFRNQ